MASKYELSISSNYVNNWGVTEAIREIFQNALDEQIQNPKNEMYFSYEDGTLLIGNKNSSLSKSTLLLGVTSKSNSGNTIGQFGEGYKIAVTVLLRLGKTITIYNYGAKEIWNTKLVKSRRYDGLLVPTFYVDKLMFRKVPNYDLIFEISDISEDEMEDLKDSNLNLQDLSDCDILESPGYGRILKDPEFKGNIYVSGLYICNNDDLEYGYDFNPDQIKLGRDRDLVSSFDIGWAVSKMIAAAKDSDRLPSDISTDSEEFRYMGHFMNGHMKENYGLDFIKEHGDDSYPVCTNDEYQNVIKSNRKPIMVKSWQKDLILESGAIKEITNIGYEGISKGNLYDIFTDFLSRNRLIISDSDYDFMCDLIEKHADDLSDIEENG